MTLIQIIRSDTQSFHFRHGDYVLAYEEIAYEFDNLETITSGKRSGWLKDSFCVYILAKVT